MPRYLTFILVLLSLSTLKAKAQNSHNDSIKKIAVVDARKFKLDKARLKDFKKNRRDLQVEYMENDRSDTSVRSFRQHERGDVHDYVRNRQLASDYFKPVASAVSDTALLKDSVYVKAYRGKAWQRTSHRRTFGHYAWITTTVMAGAEIIAAFAFLFIHANH